MAWRRIAVFRSLHSTQNVDRWLGEILGAFGRYQHQGCGTVVLHTAVKQTKGLNDPPGVVVCLLRQLSPLHDGAVIVSGDHIVAAAASLPLTSNLRYRKLYGMRHKAAIGVSEVSDAVVIVISEETNRISVACEGMIEYDIGRNEFRDRLTNFLDR